MNLKADFFEKYKRLETLLNVEVNSSDSISINQKFEEAIAKDKRLNQFKYDFFTLTKIRNLIAHNDSTNFYHITQNAIITIDNLINLLESPERAFQFSTKPITSMQSNELVVDGIRLMSEKKFSFLPILENSMIFGVFSSDVLNHIFKEEKELIFDKSLTFNKISSYLSLNNHLNERFEFVNRNEIKSNIEKMFVNSYKFQSNKDKHLGCVFVTQNGKLNEKILGIITIWDVLN